MAISPAYRRFQRLYRRRSVSRVPHRHHYSSAGTKLTVVHRPFTAIIAVALLASGCSYSATAAPEIARTALAPMTNLPPITEAPEPTTTTEPRDAEPPSVEMTIRNDEVVDWYRGTITLATEADAEVTVNGEPAGLDLGGSVRVPVMNAPGENTIVITATDAAGNTTEESVVYTFDPPKGWIAAVGDSTMLGAKDEIEARLGSDVVDATVSRQFLDAPGLVAGLFRRENPPQAVIVGLGTNGPVQARHLDQVMDTVGPETLVAFINVRVPRDWEATSNDAIASGVHRYDNAILIDWFSVADERNELVAGDGFHPSQAGRVVFADLIAEAILPDWEPAES